MKVSSKIYKGIEFVQLNELPKDQKDKISQAFTEDSLIKILIDDTIVSNCIQYKEYELWFETVYRKSIQLPVVRPERFTESTKELAVSLGEI